MSKKIALSDEQNIFAYEVKQEIMERGFDEIEADNLIRITMVTIHGCFDREMTAEETVNLILTGQH